MRALEPFGIKPRTVVGVTTVIATSWIVGTTVTLLLSIQVARLARMMRRVRKYLDLKMNKKKQREHDDTKYKEMNTRFLIKQEDMTYVPNPTRNQLEIKEAQKDVGSTTTTANRMIRSNEGAAVVMRRAIGIIGT